LVLFLYLLTLYYLLNVSLVFTRFYLDGRDVTLADLVAVFTFAGFVMLPAVIIWTIQDNWNTVLFSFAGEAPIEPETNVVDSVVTNPAHNVVIMGANIPVDVRIKNNRFYVSSHCTHVVGIGKSLTAAKYDFTTAYTAVLNTEGFPGVNYARGEEA
jgi:hypothetical protein